VHDLFKYAVVERERRFLIADVPGGVIEVRQIVDYYVDGTRLRLRELIASDGTVTRKLGHKVRLKSGLTEVACTSIYLDDREWELLRALPSRMLRKTRHIIERDGICLAVDELDDGTLLAEIDDADASPCAVPDWLQVLREVTTDEKWTGAHLAT
jgi:CYTH domain-containing protein